MRLTARTITALLTLYMLQQCNSVIIDGASNDPYIAVELTDDPRGINAITRNDYWKLYQFDPEPLYDWPLKMTLNARKYAFQSGKESKLIIQMDGLCQPQSRAGDCDAFYAFSIGDQYITFAHDFDNYFHVNGIRGIKIYPACNTNLIATGDASQLIPSNASNQFSATGLRNALAGGDGNNWYQLSSTPNGNNFPVTFEFINDDVADTFTVRFRSSTFRRGLECVYYSARATGEDFKFYFTPDTGLLGDDYGGEIIKVKSFDISGENIGTDCEFCDCAASAHVVPETIIWSGIISMVISLMTVFVSYIVCIKPTTNTQIYDKVRG